jgi:exopolysaccharide biosynthesis protein
METKENKVSFIKILGKFLLRALSFVLTFVAAVAVTLLISLKMLCSDSFPHVQQTFVTTILETGQLKFLASWFLSSEEIQAIVDQNSMKEFNVEVDTDLIQLGGFGNAGLESGNVQDSGDCAAIRPKPLTGKQTQKSHLTVWTSSAN